MSLFYVYVSLEVQIVLAILNFVACACFVTIRVYHQTKQRTRQLRLSAMGLSCMLVASLQCLGLINNNVEWYFGNVDRYCDFSMRLASAAYTLHRVLLYTFIILRLEVVNKSNFLKAKFISASKVAMVPFGIFMVSASIAYTSGVEGEEWSCVLKVDNSMIIGLFLLDTIICLSGTWMFVRPIRKTLIAIESDTLRITLRKTIVWSMVSLLSTMISLLTVALVRGSGGVVGFDCSVTSFCLLVMMSPVKHKIPDHEESREYSNQFSTKGMLELKDITPPPDTGNQLRPSDDGKPLRQSEILMNKEIDEILSEDQFEQLED